MKKNLGLVLACGMLITAGLAHGGVSVGGKLWYANVDGLDAALLWGVSGSLDFGESGFWLSGTYLTGTFDEETSGAFTVDTTDSELIFGYRASIVDIGVGVRYAVWTLGFGGDSEDLAHYGPMAYLGAGSLFGNSPLGWYVSGSYMFLDLGDLYDEDEADTLEHWNAEGGLFLAWQSLGVTAGYRYKKYTKIDDLTFDGVVANLSLRF